MFLYLTIVILNYSNHAAFLTTRRYRLYNIRRDKALNKKQPRSRAWKLNRSLQIRHLGMLEEKENKFTDSYKTKVTPVHFGEFPIWLI